MHGKGVLHRCDGVKLSGIFQHGQLCGIGTMKSLHGDSYEGNFMTGKRDGYGEYEWANGSSYRGQWLNDQMNGIGQLCTVTCGRDVNARDNENHQHHLHQYHHPATDLLKILEAVVSYDGDFVQDTLHGDGIAEMIDGSIYQGKVCIYSLSLPFLSDHLSYDKSYHI